MLLVAVSACGSVANLENNQLSVHGSIYYSSPAATGSGKPVLHGPESGTIEILNADGTRVGKAIEKHHSFVFLIPGGTYIVRAKSGRAHCPDVHMHGQAGDDLQANVICSVG